MRRFMLMSLTVAVSLVAASGAQAVMVNDTDAGGDYGVALVPGTLAPPPTGPGPVVPGTTIPIVTSTTSQCDPWLSSDLLQPTDGLCWHGGDVMHANETFAIAWDPERSYWAGTKDYLEQFLQDVAAGSGTLSSPYAVTSQYADGTPDSTDSTDTIGRAENRSIYGGGCVDYGSPGGYTCQFGDTTGSGTGLNYPNAGSGDCQATLSGTNQFYEEPDGTFASAPNDICLTDSDIRAEIEAMAGQLQGHFEPGYTPTIVVLTPPGVEVCLDSTGALCSASAGNAAPAQFCSYHSEVDGVAYVVQPWVAQWHVSTGCVEPDAPVIPETPTPAVLATDAGAQLVSPLSQSQIATIVNPDLNGWFALDGAEINDNGCVPLDQQRDGAIVGASDQNPYFLQREFNNAGAIESDPNAVKCAPDVVLSPAFVVPSAVNVGDVVDLDGSTTVSSLIVPKANYSWTFGDGTTAVGPSVEHSYTKGGAYTVTLTVTDRGGNTASVSQTINVLGPTGEPVTSPTTTTTPATPPFRVGLQLLPQGLRALLRSGLYIEVGSDQAAAGFVTVSISRSAARRAHIRAGRGATVVVGRGIVPEIGEGVASLRVRFSRSMGKKLGRLAGVTLTIRLTLTAAGGAHVAVDAAGRY
jgi:hypothetical protein